MPELTGTQKKYLRGLAHDLNPLVLVGKAGITPALLESAREALDHHELIKVRFNEFKEKKSKQDLSERIAAETGASMAGMIGHVVIFYRQHPNPEKRRITLPGPGSDD